MSRRRPALSLWITTGLMIGVLGALLGAGGPGLAQACSCVEIAAAGAVAPADRVLVRSVEPSEPAVGADTTLPTDAPTSGKNSTAGLLVLIGVVVIIGTGALVLTLKYRKP
jgi:hypothetical protein